MEHEKRRPRRSLAVRSEAARWGRLVVQVRPPGRFARAPLGRGDRVPRSGVEARSLHRRATDPIDQPSAASPVVRALRSDDADALVRMHARCGAASLHRRYFTSMVPEALVRRLARPDGTSRMGVVATVGTEVVGVAHCCQAADGSAEFAILVEDAHQRRGVGVALTRRLLATVTHVSTVHSLTQVDNPAVARLLRRAGYTFRRRFQDGLVRLDVDLGAASEPGLGA